MGFFFFQYFFLIFFIQKLMISIKNFKNLLKLPGTKRIFTIYFPIESVSDAYLKLHLISYKFVLPNTLNLENLFKILPNVAWTNKGPISINDIENELHLSKEKNNDLYIRSLDKFPCLTDYVIPKKVSIADASRVRLGAYLSEGTTIMHEGFVNFNAGTLGKAMIEGRISAGVVVGNNSDLGGGSSTMGTFQVEIIKKFQLEKIVYWERTLVLVYL